MPEDRALLSLAAGLARRAGRLLREERPADLQVRAKSTPTDAVTVMDQAAERLLVDGLLAARPDDGVLAEEGDERTGRSGVRWIIDPLDGTVNYLYGLPGYGVSVAAEVDGEVRVGVVLDVAADRLYQAVRGGGASCDGEALRCSSAGELAAALVGTGFGYDADRRAQQAAALVHVLPAVRDIRRFGAAAVDLCLVAAGRLDAYYERGLGPWDLAAGRLVAQEAGAVVTGAPRALVVAAPPGLHPALSALLEAAGA